MPLNLLILNCNNTLRQSIKDPGSYINEPTDQRIIPEAQEAINRLDVTWSIVTIHNAGGVTARPKKGSPTFQTFDQAVAIERYTLKLAPRLKVAYFCPNAFGKGRSYTKVSRTSQKSVALIGSRLPEPGMLLTAVADYSNTKTSRVVYVGDQESDEKAAFAADIYFIYVSDWYAQENI